jgi:hypothetical protein
MEFVITNFNVAVEDHSTLALRSLGFDHLALN